MTLTPNPKRTMAVGYLKNLEPVAEGLVAAAQMTAVAARRKWKEHRRRRIGAVLRPGPDTPIWNELARAAAAELHRYGEKAKLARILGVSRQRLHVYLVAKTACPDAERSLQLLLWLQDRRRGREPA